MLSAKSDDLWECTNCDASNFGTPHCTSCHAEREQDDDVLWDEDGLSAGTEEQAVQVEEKGLAKAARNVRQVGPEKAAALEAELVVFRDKMQKKATKAREKTAEEKASRDRERKEQEDKEALLRARSGDLKENPIFVESAELLRLLVLACSGKESDDRLRSIGLARSAGVDRVLTALRKELGLALSKEKTFEHLTSCVSVVERHRPYVNQAINGLRSFSAATLDTDIIAVEQQYDRLLKAIQRQKTEGLLRPLDVSLPPSVPASNVSAARSSTRAPTHALSGRLLSSSMSDSGEESPSPSPLGKTPVTSSTRSSRPRTGIVAVTTYQGKRKKVKRPTAAPSSRSQALPREDRSRSPSLWKPALAVGISGMGLFGANSASTVATTTPAAWSLFTNICAYLPVGCWCLLLVGSAGWLAYNIYLSCKQDEELPQLIRPSA